MALTLVVGIGRTSLNISMSRQRRSGEKRGPNSRRNTVTNIIVRRNKSSYDAVEATKCAVVSVVQNGNGCMRIIKKYPNRRLYDTEQSRYITLVDLQKLVVGGEEFQVIDANSSKDLTRNILLQIISEEESGGKPMFTTEILLKIIRFYGDSVQDALTDYLEQSLGLFDEQQKAFQGQMRGVMQENPMTSLMTEMTKKNLEIWQDVQNSFFKSSGLPVSSEKSKDKS
jgi:polyhydroxyalkanoate synthesis repressor PhaR